MNIFSKNRIEICAIIFIYMLITCLFTIKLARIFFDDKDVCLDTGFCKEGINVNIKGIRIVVNEQSCVDNFGIWDSDKKVCRFKN